jgi:hypothetical protein
MGHLLAPEGDLLLLEVAPVLLVHQYQVQVVPAPLPATRRGPSVARCDAAVAAPRAESAIPWAQGHHAQSPPTPTPACHRVKSLPALDHPLLAHPSARVPDSTLMRSGIARLPRL